MSTNTKIFFLNIQISVKKIQTAVVSNILMSLPLYIHNNFIWGYRYLMYGERTMYLLMQWQ